MISDRESLLSAIRRAELTPQGVMLGSVSFVYGLDLKLNITDEAARRLLITKVKLAPSRFFAPGALWEIPCLDGIMCSSRYGMKATLTESQEPPF